MAETEEKEAVPKEKPKMMLFVLIGLVVVVVVLLIVLLLKDPAPPPQPAQATATTDSQGAEEAAGGSEGSAPAGQETAVHYPMDSFIVNLNEADDNRYLKVKLTLELTSPDLVIEIDSKKPQVRDRILSYLSSLSMADTKGIAGKEAIRENIAKRVNRMLSKGKVRDVFFQEFILQ